MKPSKKACSLVIEKRAVKDIKALIVAEEARIERWEASLTKAGKKAAELRLLSLKMEV